MAAKKTAATTEKSDVSRRGKVDDAMRDRVRAAHAKGMNNREIATEVGVCPQTVSKVLEQLELVTNGKPGRKPQVKAVSSEPKAVA